jgi:hypothetical protein
MPLIPKKHENYQTNPIFRIVRHSFSAPIRQKSSALPPTAPLVNPSERTQYEANPAPKTPKFAQTNPMKVLVLEGTSI